MTRRRQGGGHAPSFASVQRGVTLVELMISMALSLFVVLAATALFVSTKSGYLAQDDNVQMEETGRYAIEIIGRAVRQAAYENWDAAEVAATAPLSPSVSGLDARSIKARTPGIDSPVTKSINGSDVVAIRFSGSGGGSDGDGTMHNCAGFGVPAAQSKETAEESRGWSIFYVATDSSGEPELYCKYRGDSSWAAQSIARGVESFQALYELDTDADGLPNEVLNATAINALDDALPLRGVNDVERAADLNRQTHWKKVVAVRVALLVRGVHATRSEAGEADYELFGKDYPNGHAAADLGVRIRESDLPKGDRGRARRVFSATIRLRNSAAGSGA